MEVRMNHQETVSGLHKCQPKNAPEAGTIKNMVVLNMPAKNGKKAWIKIKSEKPEKGGSPYRLLNVEPLDWPPDDYGNIAFNIEVEATTAQPSAFGTARATMQQGEDDHDPPFKPDSEDRSEWRERAPDSSMPRSNGNGGRKVALDVQRAIIRQHSQSMALEVLKLKLSLNELSVEDLTPAKLKTLADYFDTDVEGAAS